jgi:ABC-type transport system involved in multi-copper enzyme maturation permease subunit
MRSGLAAGLMGIGWILISFGAVIAVLYVFAKQGGGDSAHLAPQMATGAVGSLVVGGVMFAAGYLLSRVGRSSDRASA